MKDRLTGLLNRKSIIEHLDKFLEKTNSPAFSLLFVDIDLFKAVNDFHGFIGGDKVIVKIAEELSKQVQSRGFASRYGGEEFAILLPETNVQTATKLAESIRIAIENTDFFPQEYYNQITVTILVKELSKNTSYSNAEEILQQLNDSVFEVKKSGRNRVQVI
jgi:diguanylate cyclase (GGDEF)-like protein